MTLARREKHGLPSDGFIEAILVPGLHQIQLSSCSTCWACPPLGRGSEAGQPTAMKCWRGVLYGKQIVRLVERVELLIRRHTADPSGHYNGA
jgi:hypothetical protein